ncbi:MAG: hypothetical protein Q9167_004020 [Letrouitia subvulpina]
MHYLAGFATCLAFVSIAIATPTSGAPLEVVDDFDADHVHPQNTTTTLQKRASTFFTGFKTSNPKTTYGFHPGQEPADCIKEITGQSTNINDGFRGLFVWICPQWTTSIDIDVNVLPSAIVFQKASGSFNGFMNGDRSDDLSKGAEGDPRYLYWGPARWLWDWRPTVILRVGLWRTKSPQIRVQSPYVHMTGNINEGRGGDFLYVVWS